MHPSIANLSSRLHLCAGDVPPPLVGASATLVEHAHNGAPSTAHVYLFGGRLVSSRRMVNSLYRLDLDHMKWSKLTPTTKPLSSDSSSSAQTLPAHPQPRYFHSADLWNDKIIFFGGMGYSQRPSQDANAAHAAATPADELCVLDELLAFDLTTQQWDYSFDVVSRHFDAQPSHSSTDSLRPAPRYAHLSSLSGDTLSIVGGQNLANQYVESINLFSLSRNQWFGAQRFRKQCGSYRSLAVGAKSLYKNGEKAKCYPRAKDPLEAADANGAQQPSASPSTSSASAPPNANASPSKPAKVEQNPLPMSYTPAAEEPLPVYLYSNYNFTDVRRELEVLTLRADADASPASSDADKAQQQRSRSASNASQDSALDVDGPLTPSQASAPASSGPFVSMQDRSNHMGGVTLPPGLRFPTGALLGPYLLISGTYLANATQSFSIWALHLPTMVWSRIESGSALSTGSWNRALLWPAKNRLVVVGHKERDLVSDYNHRQTNWDHVVVLELEAWGIYQPPASPLSEAAVQLGLDKLAASAPSAMASAHALARGGGALGRPNATDATSPTAPDAGAATPENGGDHAVEHELEALSLGGRGDFEIVCSDGLRIGCDRALLEARWPWFRSKMDEFRCKARRTLRIAYPATNDQFGLGIIPEDIADFLAEEDDEEDEPIDPLVAPSGSKDAAKHRIKDPRFQPRHLQISEPSPVVLALLQYIYTLRIGTALQRHPAVVCALMVLARTYGMEELAVWARHAAHVALADDLNPKTSGSARGADALSPSSSMTHAMDSGESGGLELFRPAESLGLHPEERHRLAVCLYEAASLCGCEGLQIRALRVVMAIARWLQKHGAGPNGGGGGAGVGKQQGRGDGASRDRSGSSSHHASGSNGAGAVQLSSGTLRGGSSNYRNAMGGSLGAGASPMLQMPSPVPSMSMSRAGSDTASSHGPLTPNSVYQSFLDRRGDSFSSSTDAAPTHGSALAYLNEVESLDDHEGPDYRKLSSAQDFSSSRLDKIAEASTRVLPEASPSIVAPHEAGATESGASGGSTRKRFSLFGRGMVASSTPQVAEPVAEEVARCESSMGDAMQAGTTLLDRRASSSQTSSPLLASEEWSSRFRLPRHSMSSRDAAAAAAVSTSAASSGLNSPALTMDPKRRHLQTSAASSPASEQFAVNSYGPRSEQDQASRSASQHSLSTEASGATNGGLERSGSSASAHGATATPLVGIEMAQDVSHLSGKEIAKLQREERKRVEREEKQRKKAEKAEYKRLAAEAVFGPKGSAGPSPALSSSDFAMYTAGTAGEAGAVSSRRSSEPSDSHSGTSTASPRTGSSLRTAYSPRSPATTAPAKRGEWSVTTANTASPWFSAPPPLMSAPGLKGMPRGNRSASSLSGRSSAKTRLTS
ncbi:kelch repeat-containing proteins [Moesziomyces antarcticus T-34]|uniref:Kelch repeat-containing proteins n=1 Tax=Pseudozyma antarctica (strain T-34) TaxID=1151754 RepID=M9LUH4_PSEA3|nr:kelch repeat-containing proteins [Moesziomyces antarcticus T-34]